MRIIWVTGLLAALLFGGLAVYLAPLQPDILALQFTFTPRAFGIVAHTWPAAHLELYRRHLPIDGLLLLAYGSFGYLLSTRTRVLSALRPLARRAVTWALPAAACFDATENALHWWLTELPRFGVPLPYALAGGAASLKWLCIIGFGLAIAYALAASREA
jgi:hypothetical protein